MNYPIQFKIATQPGNEEAYQECKEFIQTMQKIMRLRDWDMRLVFASSDITAQNNGTRDMVAWHDPEIYQRVTIGVNCEHEQANDELEQSIIHELCHVIANEFCVYVDTFCETDQQKEIAYRLKERMVENFARAIWNAMNWTP